MIITFEYFIIKIRLIIQNIKLYTIYNLIFFDYLLRV
uniref:Uncharacterized protein n=1 Tax=Corynecladia elata TaxID=3101723 RepID=A0AA51RE93_9FLOR|nr:hypothetical protein RU988_pgp160 [Laurencia elata]WMP12634.1 hypothetical protein [Laurencia elata]